MAINYRSAPMIFRRPDPSCWFSSLVRSQVNFAGDKGEPDTPIIPTYPGERLRIRLIQGSHEEQHGFTTHGLRWRRDWGHPDATLVNQQSLGISEAFTLDINSADASSYGIGDHLWRASAIAASNRIEFRPARSATQLDAEFLRGARGADESGQFNPALCPVPAWQCHAKRLRLVDQAFGSISFSGVSGSASNAGAIAARASTKARPWT